MKMTSIDLMEVIFCDCHYMNEAVEQSTENEPEGDCHDVKC
ncbi:hypothetical protein ACQKD4_12425 [Exiguobacterium sp. NPDC077395]